METVNTHEDAQESPENDAKMAQIGEQLREDNSQEERPEWLPEKFKSANDMAKAYNELEKKFTQERMSPKEEEEGVDNVEEVESEDKQVEEALEEVGLDFDAISQRFIDNDNTYTEDDYSALEAQGISKEIADDFAQGQAARSLLLEYQVYEEIGGKEEFQKLQTWAGNSLSEREADLFNTATESGDLDTVLSAVKGLQARYTQEYGSLGEPLAGQAAQSAPDRYSSVFELRQAMSDPRYRDDPAFRAKVESKLASSNIL